MTSIWNDSPYFRHWAKPGPRIYKTADPELQPTDEESLDALCGHYRIFQLNKGHRYSTDDMLISWYASSWCPSAQTALDLGSGIGSVGMTVAWRLQGVRMVTIEAQDISVHLARKSARLNELIDRYEIRHGDFRDPELLSADEKFDLIMGSPPYFPLEAGIHGSHPQKIACRFEMRGTIADYCQVAADHLNWGGMFACIFPIQPEHQAQRVIKGAQEAGLTIVRQRPIMFKEGEPPLLCLFAMTRSDHLPDFFRNQTWIEPPLIIRTKAGNTHPEYNAIALSMGLPPHQ